MPNLSRRHRPIRITADPQFAGDLADAGLNVHRFATDGTIVVNSVYTTVVRRGRLLRAVDAIEPVWHSQGRAIKIVDLSDSHIWNILQKLQVGRDRGFEKGTRHQQYDNLMAEAARRGLCLNIRPNVSRMESVAAALMGRPSSGAVHRQSALSEAMRDRTAAQAPQQVASGVSAGRTSVVQAFRRAVQHRP